VAARRVAWGAYLVCLLITAMLYVIVLSHTEFTVAANAAHDDGLYIRLGQFLANGRWLGPYDQLTLWKRAGYPLFLRRPRAVIAQGDPDVVMSVTA